MTTSQEQFLTQILSGEPISLEALAYFRARLRTKLHQFVLREFLRQRNDEDVHLTRADLARRIGKKPEQVTRWLGAPGNWTLDTFSDLMLGMGIEPTFSATPLANRLFTETVPSMDLMAQQDVTTGTQWRAVPFQSLGSGEPVEARAE